MGIEKGKNDQLDKEVEYAFIQLGIPLEPLYEILAPSDAAAALKRTPAGK